MHAVTLPDPYSDVSSTPPPGPPPGAAPGAPDGTAAAARRVTAGMRELVATALLAGNAVFLFLGISDLLFVVSGWVGGFGARSQASFGIFVGPAAILLPLGAMLLATHLSPRLPHTRALLLAALAEYAVSAVFGLITYLGSFAYGLFAVRETFDGLLRRAVWLAFLTIAAAALWRVFRALYPPAPRPTYAYGPTMYGRPYPGQPSYPRPGNFRVSEPRYDGPIYDPAAGGYDPTEQFPAAEGPTAPMPAPTAAGYGPGVPPYVPGPVTYPPLVSPAAPPAPPAQPGSPPVPSAQLPPVTGGTTDS